MDWLVWLGLICVIGGAGLFAFGMRHDPMLAAGVPGGMTLLTAVLLFLILSGSPSSSPPATRNDAETKDPSDPPRPNPAALILPRNAEEPAAAEGAVDLLSEIELPKGQLNGRWTIQDGALISPMTRGDIPAKLTIPVRPPESFQLIVVMERLQGQDSITFGFPVGGQDVMVCIDGYGGIYSGINLIDRATADRNESSRRGPFLRNGEPNTIVCTVGPDSVHATVNGKTAVDWRGDVRRLSLDRRWPHGPLGQIELGSWQTSYRITRLELRPLP